MTASHFRRIALSMAGAVESAHMDHPDFRVNGRIFATLTEDGKQGMVKLTPDQQAVFLREHAGMFSPASGAWGRQGCTMVLLSKADEETIGEAMTLAWQETAKKRPAKARPKKPAARRGGPSGPARLRE